MRTVRQLGGASPPARIALTALVLTLSLSLPGKVAAQAAPSPPVPADYQPPPWPAAPSAGQLLGRLALLTAGTLGSLGAALWLARRRLQAPAPVPAQGPGPRVVASVPLAGRCALHLLQVDQAGFVVATDAGGLKAIHLLQERFDDLIEGAAGAETVAVDPDPPACELSPRRVG